MAKIQELGGIELLPHTAYSPDLAPSDYHLFQYKAHFLRAGNFENIEAVEVGLAERWLKTTESDGLYFEEQFNFLSENIPKIFFQKRH